MISFLIIDETRTRSIILNQDHIYLVDPLFSIQADEDNLDDTEKEVEGDSVQETAMDSEDSIDEEIAKSVRKNMKAKKVEKVRGRGLLWQEPMFGFYLWM